MQGPEDARPQNRLQELERLIEEERKALGLMTVVLLCVATFELGYRKATENAPRQVQFRRS